MLSLNNYRLFVCIVVLLFCASCGREADERATGVGDIGQKLRAFDSGKLSLDELTESAGQEGRVAIIEYHKRFSNAVSDHSKLAVSRCYAIEDQYEIASRLAEEFVAVHPNEPRGWRIIGGANLVIANYGKAIWGYTNAVILRDEESFTPLAGALLAGNRLDLLGDIVPHLLILKQVQRTSLEEKLEIVGVLALFAGRTGQKDVFLKAVEGFTADQILSRRNTAEIVARACDEFNIPEITTLCEVVKAGLPRKVDAGLQHGNPSTNVTR